MDGFLDDLQRWLTTREMTDEQAEFLAYLARSLGQRRRMRDRPGQRTLEGARQIVEEWADAAP